MTKRPFEHCSPTELEISNRKTPKIERKEYEYAVKVWVHAVC